MSQPIVFVARLGAADVATAPAVTVRYVPRREWVPPSGWAGTNPYRAAQRRARAQRKARKRRRGF